MSNIKQAIEQINEPGKSIGKILIEFYETMKGLENDSERGGKQATKIVMTMSDPNGLFEKMYPVPEVLEITPIVPTDFRIKEKALECLKGGECDSFNNPEELFTAGAIWMREMLIQK